MSYWFGCTEFDIERAYNDCKMVFDGITDDRGFQEADSGLLFYQANEIIYALKKCMEIEKSRTSEK